MKHIWKIAGTYLDWELTVRVRPAAHPPQPITESDLGSAVARMKRVGQHFHDAANLHEYSMEFESAEHVAVRLGRAGADR